MSTSYSAYLCLLAAAAFEMLWGVKRTLVGWFQPVVAVWSCRDLNVPQCIVAGQSLPAKALFR